MCPVIGIQGHVRTRTTMTFYRISLLLHGEGRRGKMQRHRTAAGQVPSIECRVSRAAGSRNFLLIANYDVIGRVCSHTGCL